MLSLVLLVCVLCSVYLWLRYARVESSLHALPPAFPGKLPVIGHTLVLLKYLTNLQELLTSAAEHCAKQGGVTHGNFGSELYYLINDPQDAFTAANVCTKKHYVFDLAKGWMGDGLIISSGDIWKRHRKLLAPAFTLPVIHGFLDVFNSMSRKLASSVEPHVGKGQFDHFPYLKKNALETLCVGTFGIDPIKDAEFTQKYMESVEKMVKLGITRAIQFWLQNDFIYRLVGLKKKEEEVVGNLHAMAIKVLQEKKASIKNEALNKNTGFDITGNKYKPFLDLLIDLSKNGALTDTEIREEMDTIIAAGFETTSTQLTYALLQLGAHPEVQEKLYKELLEVLGPNRDVEKDDVNKLVYTNAVIMESLRILPSIPVLLRDVEKDVRLIGTFGIDPIKDAEFTQKYMESVEKMVKLGITRAIQFWLQNDFIYRLVGLKKKEEEVVGNLHAMAIKVLQEKKASIKNEALNKNTGFDITGNKYKPFLDLLIDLSKNGALTDTEIREEMDTIIAAGFETTSTQLTYALLQLGAHPEVQEKLYKELLEVLGPNRDVEKDDVNKLVYTNAVIMESLRILPSIPVLLRDVEKDVRLKNYTMRAGSYCVIFPLATHLDPSWGAESDQFRPERWLDGEFRNNKEFAAFGLGKRACIGRTYAMISMKVTLAHFIRQYRVTADLSKLKIKYEFVMRPESGYEISIERRM